MFLVFVSSALVLTLPKASILHNPNSTLLLSPPSFYLPQIVSPPACDQVVVQQCCVWIMMCWISPNLVMDVLLPFGRASMDGWTFIRFYSASVYNSWRAILCVGGVNGRTKLHNFIWVILCILKNLLHIKNGKITFTYKQQKQKWSKAIAQGQERG